MCPCMVNPCICKLNFHNYQHNIWISRRNMFPFCLKVLIYSRMMISIKTVWKSKQWVQVPVSKWKNLTSVLLGLSSKLCKWELRFIYFSRTEFVICISSLLLWKWEGDKVLMTVTACHKLKRVGSANWEDNKANRNTIQGT